MDGQVFVQRNQLKTRVIMLGRLTSFPPVVRWWIDCCFDPKGTADLQQFAIERRPEIGETSPPDLMPTISDLIGRRNKSVRSTSDAKIPGRSPPP